MVFQTTKLQGERKLDVTDNVDQQHRHRVPAPAYRSPAKVPVARPPTGRGIKIGPDAVRLLTLDITAGGTKEHGDATPAYRSRKHRFSEITTGSRSVA